MDVPVPTQVVVPTPPATLQVPTPPLPSPNFQLATSGQRFGNYFIDAIVVYIALFAIETAFVGQLKTWGFLANVAVYIAYYLATEGTSGKSLAKYVTRTRVVMEDGSPVSFNAVATRAIVRCVPFEALSFLSGARPRGWHDKWSGTMVIEDK